MHEKKKLSINEKAPTIKEYDFEPMKIDGEKPLFNKLSYE